MLELISNACYKFSYLRTKAEKPELFVTQQKVSFKTHHLTFLTYSSENVCKPEFSESGFLELAQNFAQSFTFSKSQTRKLVSLFGFTNCVPCNKTRNFNSLNKIYQVLAGMHMEVQHPEKKLFNRKRKKKKSKLNEVQSKKK